MTSRVAVIADIVGSRTLADRAGAQRAIIDTSRQVHDDHPVAESPLAPTVGDEFQAVFHGLAAALTSLLLIQLHLPEGIGLRFGLGVGAVDPVGGDITDGPGWWAARAAIDRFESETGALDILINNAGIQHRAPLEDFPPDAFQRLLQTNVASVFNVAQACARLG